MTLGDRLMDSQSVGQDRHDHWGAFDRVIHWVDETDHEDEKGMSRTTRWVDGPEETEDDHFVNLCLYANYCSDDLLGSSCWWTQLQRETARLALEGLSSSDCHGQRRGGAAKGNTFVVLDRAANKFWTPLPQKIKKCVIEWSSGRTMKSRRISASSKSTWTTHAWSYCRD